MLKSHVQESHTRYLHKFLASNFVHTTDINLNTKKLAQESISDVKVSSTSQLVQVS